MSQNRFELLEKRFIGKSLNVVGNEKINEIDLNKENIQIPTHNVYPEQEKSRKRESSDQVKDKKDELETTTIMDSLKNEISKLTLNLNEREVEFNKLQHHVAKQNGLIEKFILSNLEQFQRARKKRLLKNSFQLGTFKNVRNGVRFTEKWENGEKIIKLEKNLLVNQKSKEELEKKRKQLLKQSKVNVFSENSNQKEGTETLSEAEIIKLQLLSLKKEETEINNKMDQLIKSRNQHLRELRVLDVENCSRFKTGSKMNDERYILLHAVGKGGFSEVFKAFDLKKLRDVAIKIHQVFSNWNNDKVAQYMKHAMREFDIHKELEHPNIVKLYDVFVIDDNSFCSVLEFCETDLDYILKQYKLLPEREAKLILSQIMSALMYLNEKKPAIIHYDLKPANILFTDINNWHIKLTDFGLSKIMPENISNNPDVTSMELTSQGTGTYWYLPPECFLQGKDPPKISSKVDVWALGVVFFQMLYGEKPFGNQLRQSEILDNKTILNAKTVEFRTRPNVSNDGKNFIRKCLTYEKNDRPDVLHLAEDVYLSNVLQNTSRSKLSPFKNEKNKFDGSIDKEDTKKTILGFYEKSNNTPSTMSL